MMTLPANTAASGPTSNLRVPIIGPNDLQIAAIALVDGLTLVTHNITEFSQMPGLNLEDWQARP